MLKLSIWCTRFEVIIVVLYRQVGAVKIYATAAAVEAPPMDLFAGFGPNSGFWCCVFLTLRKTLICTRKEQMLLNVSIKLKSHLKVSEKGMRHSLQGPGLYECGAIFHHDLEIIGQVGPMTPKVLM